MSHLQTKEFEYNETTSSSVGGAGGGLKRRRSWKVFKETVKETVQNLVGSAGGQQVQDGGAEVPSAVYPSAEVNKATTNVTKVLQRTNCYSGKSGDAAIPQIVVTSDRSPEMTPCEWMEEETEMKKKMAVMKIKQAIMSAEQQQVGLNVDNSKAMERRHSDTTQMAAVVATKQQNSPSPAPQPKLNPQPKVHQRRKSTSDALAGSGSSSSAAPVARSSSVKKAKPKPMIWEYFDKVPNTSQQGKCKACRMAVSCKFNTGNFVRHLQVAHMNLYRQYQNKIESQWTKSMMERNLR